MVSFVLGVVLVLAVLVLIGYVAGYNRIRSADVRVAEALSGIDVELTRRAALIPALVHTVQTFATHEKAILDHVTDARAALTSATAGKSVAERSAAEKQLDSALDTAAGARAELPAAELLEQLPRPAAQPRRHRGQTRVRPAVLQRRRRHAQSAAQHDPVDVRRATDQGGGEGVLPSPPVTPSAAPYTGSVRLVFAGTPEPALPSLQRLIESPRHDVVAVLTRPDAAAGRRGRPAPSPVAQLALDHEIPVLRPARPNSAEFVAELTALAPDCCAVVAYGALLGDALLGVPPRGWVNLHFSLLPAWRGAAPVQAALAAGDAVTGATTFQIEPSLDSGPVYGVVTETVRPTDTAGELLGRLAVSGAALLEATMDGIADGGLTPAPQPAEGVSVAPKVTVEDARIRWELPAHVVDRRIRSVTPNPGAWTMIAEQRVKIGPVTPSDPDDDPLEPGRIDVGKKHVRIGTGSVPVLLGSVQPPGKKPMSAADWARGARLEDAGWAR